MNCNKAEMLAEMRRDFSPHYVNNKNTTEQRDYEYDNNRNNKHHIDPPAPHRCFQQLKISIPLAKSPTPIRKTSMHTVRSPSLQRKIYSIESDPRDSEEDVNDNKLILPKRGNVFRGDLSYEYSTSSDESEILKTNEGFIIPAETITKIIGNESKPLKLHEESVKKQEDIERLFKKENFLKNIPVKRSRLSSTPGVVTQLKSRFEHKTGTLLLYRVCVCVCECA